jgi:hypothetical protein
MTDKKNVVKKETAKSEEEATGEFNASVHLRPAVMSAALIEFFSKNIAGELDICHLVDLLETNIEEVKSGDMSSIEAMLISQAQALQTLFVSLGLKAANQTQLKQYNSFMTLALKAQSQSRATIQALVELKYPKQIAFVKQANIAHGHQQVNNGTTAQNDARLGEQPRAEKISQKPNELICENNNAALDNGRKTTTSGTNQAMATVESLDRG